MRKLGAVGKHGNRCPQAKSTYTLHLRRRAMQARCLLQVATLEEPRGQRLFGPRVVDRPGLKHTLSRNHYGAPIPPPPSGHGDRWIEPKSMLMDNVKVRGQQLIRQVWRVTEPTVR